MAGKLLDAGVHSEPDMLFDLTLDDDKRLSKSDLLSLVNYGQVKKPFTVLGHKGAHHKVEMALLWDEDYVDILKKTTKYASDPNLRVRLVRRLRLHKSIQKIGHHEFMSEDVQGQRQLWTLLLRMSDAQVEYLDGKYSEMELERNLAMADSIKALDAEMQSTAPDILQDTTQPASQESTEPVSENPVETDIVEEAGGIKDFEDPHTEIIKNHEKSKSKFEAEIKDKVGLSSMEDFDAPVVRKIKDV